VSATDLHRTIEVVWRIQSARVIAGPTRLTRDVGLVEDFAQEALLAALEQWPQSGVPENPGAWLTATAKRRGIDLFRRNAVAERKHQDLARDLATLDGDRNGFAASQSPPCWWISGFFERNSGDAAFLCREANSLIPPCLRSWTLG
jgi:predicted RNA polymerase sigma factor